MGKNSKLIAVLLSSFIILSSFTCFIIKNKTSVKEYRIKETKEVTKIIFITEKKSTTTVSSIEPTVVPDITKAPITDNTTNKNANNRTKRPYSNISKRTGRFYEAKFNNLVNSRKVYINRGESVYHNIGCHLLKKDRMEIFIEQAIKRGYKQCKYCNP